MFLVFVECFGFFWKVLQCFGLWSSSGILALLLPWSSWAFGDRSTRPRELSGQCPEGGFLVKRVLPSLSKRPIKMKGKRQRMRAFFALSF